MMEPDLHHRLTKTKDCEGMTSMTTEAKTSSMAAKLKGDGPITLTKCEANELRDTLRGLFEWNSRHPDIAIADSLEGPSNRTMGVRVFR